MNNFYDDLELKEEEILKINRKPDHTHFVDSSNTSKIGHPDPIKLAVSIFNEIENLSGFDLVSNLAVGERNTLGDIMVNGNMYNVSVTMGQNNLHKFYINSSGRGVTGKSSTDGSDTHDYRFFLTEGKYVNTFFPSNNN